MLPMFLFDEKLATLLEIDQCAIKELHLVSYATVRDHSEVTPERDVSSSKQ